MGGAASARPATVPSQAVESGHETDQEFIASPVRMRRDVSFRQRFITDSDGDLKESFEVERRPCGRGGYSCVFRATCKVTGEMRAVKKLLKSKIVHRSELDKEIAVSKMMDHPNVVKLFGTFHDDDCFYLVMEYCEGGELFALVQDQENKLSEGQVARVMEQVFRAMCYVHGKDIVHCDIKPENFLLHTRKPIEGNTIKLIDFGLSKHLEEGELLKALVGTAWYAAPEVGGTEGYGKACDMWSCGVMMYMMLGGAPPFTGRNDIEVMEKAKTGSFRMTGAIWDAVSEPAKDLIRRLLDLNVNTRFTADQCLESKWIRQNMPITRDVSDASAQEGLPPHLVSNLCNYSEASKFKKAALIAIAHQLPKEMEDDLRKSFVAMDKEGNGLLKLEEVKCWLSTALGLTLSHADLQSIVAKIDLHQDGRLSYTEFLAAVMDQRLQDSEEMCLRAFKAFDLDHNGAITLRNLREVMANSNFEEEPVSPIFKQMNSKGDGRADFKEFMAMVKKDEDVTRRHVQLQKAPASRFARIMSRSK